MKRLFLIGAAIVAAVSLTSAAHADVISTDVVNGGVATDASASDTPDAGGTMSVLNPILNKVPVLSGPDRRHICVISEQLDKSWCVYVAIP